MERRSRAQAAVSRGREEGLGPIIKRLMDLDRRARSEASFHSRRSLPISTIPPLGRRPPVMEGISEKPLKRYLPPTS